MTHSEAAMAVNKSLQIWIFVLAVYVGALYHTASAANTEQSSSMSHTTSPQIVYPGIVVVFNCDVPTPFIQVNGINRTADRGLNGYIEDLRAMGIEPKNVDSSRNSFIPTVCINGSSPELRHVDTLTIICQEIQLDNNFQPVYSSHFTLMLTYHGRVPAPVSVGMTDSNVLVWNPPPSITSSSSNTYSIEVRHVLDVTYIIHITQMSNCSVFHNIIVSATTSYDLTQANDMLEPCSEYQIELYAFNLETERTSERSSPPIIYTKPGCPVTVTRNTHSTEITSSGQHTTTLGSGSTLATLRVSNTQRNTYIIIISVTLVLCLVFCGGGFVCGILSLHLYNHTKRNNNNMVRAQVSTQPAPVYEEVFEPQCSVKMKENVAYGPINKTK